MAEAEDAARRRDRLPRARPLRRLRRAVRAPVGVARAARRAAQRRRAVVDRPPRHRAAVLQAGRRRARRAPALARGGRGHPARARRRADHRGARGTDARRLPRSAGDELARRAASGPAWTSSRSRCADGARGDPRRPGRRGRPRRSCRSRTRARAPSDSTLDALVFDAPDVRIVGEVVHAVTYCLRGGRVDRARRGLHGPLASAGARPVRRASCARSCRARRSSPSARPRTPSARSPTAGRSPATRRTRRSGRATPPGSTAPRSCARASRTTPTTPRASPGSRATATAPLRGGGPAKTILVFWGGGDLAPGWLVRCLAEFSSRGINLARIESRPAPRRARPLHVLLRSRGRA